MYYNDNKNIIIFIKTQSLVMHIKTKKTMGYIFNIYIYIYIIGIGDYVLIWKLLIWCLGGAHIGTYYGLSQEVLIKNVVLVIFCRKPHMGFWHMVDVITTWIP
jgi:hypothetical protein